MNVSIYTNNISYKFYTIYYICIYVCTHKTCMNAMSVLNITKGALIEPRLGDALPQRGGPAAGAAAGPRPGSGVAVGHWAQDPAT